MCNFTFWLCCFGAQHDTQHCLFAPAMEDGLPKPYPHVGVSGQWWLWHEKYESIILMRLFCTQCNV